MNLFSTTLKRPARRTNLDEEAAAEVLLSKDVPAIPPPTDRELLTLWLEHKDTSALEAIIRRHGPLVRSLSSRLLRSHHEQADAFQTVFLVVSQNASRIRHRESLASWIYGVTVRTCLMFSRQRSRHDPIPEETEAPSFPRQEVLEHQELVLTLNKELDLLPSHLRESLVLVYLEGYSRQAAADLTNTTEQTIKSRLARGRNLLRTRLLKRGVTFSTAFTLFSVTTTADADTLTIPDLLLNKTLDTCQTGQLPLTFPSVPLDPIAIVPTGVPLMSSTTFYGTLAVATLLLLTTLGIGNHGRADGQNTVTSAIDTSINELIPEIVEITPNVTLEQRSATTTPAPATPAAEPVQQTSLTEKQTQVNPLSSSPVNTMELSLLDREIELFKAAEKGYRDTIKKFESMSMDQLIEFYKDKGVEPEQGRKAYLEFSNHRLALCTDHLAELENRRQKLIDASKNYSAVAIDLIAEEAKLRLQLDAALAEYEQLLDRRLRIVGYHVPKKDILGNLPGEHLVPHIDEKTAELKIEMPELQAKIIDLTQRHAQVKSKLNAPVGSAVRTINPPTVATAPPAVADVDLSAGTANPRSMELQLLEIEIEMLKGSIESAQGLVKKAQEDPKFVTESNALTGATGGYFYPENDKSDEEKLEQFVSTREYEIDASKKQLEIAQKRVQELLSEPAPVSAGQSLAEVEVRRLDSELKQKQQLYEKILLAKLLFRGASLPKDTFIDGILKDYEQDPEKLKFEILKLAIEKQQAEQVLQSMQTASPAPSLPAPVGSAVGTVGPPTTPFAPPAVADVDLSPNPIHPQPAPNLPPLKQSEQSLLDLKVERAELQLNDMQRFVPGPGIVSSNDVLLKILDAKIALQEALLERERFRVEQAVGSSNSKPQVPIESPETGNTLSHTQNMIEDLKREVEFAKRIQQAHLRKPYNESLDSEAYDAAIEKFEKRIETLTQELSHKGKLALPLPEENAMRFLSPYRAFRIHYEDAHGTQRGSYVDGGGLYPGLRLEAGRHEVEFIFDEQQYWPSDPQRFRGSMELFDPSIKISNPMFGVLDKEVTRKLIEGDVNQATMIFWIPRDRIDPQAAYHMSQCEALRRDQSEQGVIADIESKQGKLLAILRLNERLNKLNPPRDFSNKKSESEQAENSTPAPTRMTPETPSSTDKSVSETPSVDPEKESDISRLKTRYRKLLDEYRRYRPELIALYRNAMIQQSVPDDHQKSLEQHEQILPYLESKLREIEAQIGEQSAVDLMPLRQKTLEHIRTQFMADLNNLEAALVRGEIDQLKGIETNINVEKYQEAIEIFQEQLKTINEELKAKSFTDVNANATRSSPPAAGNDGIQTSLVDIYPVDADGTRLTTTPALTFDDLRSYQLKSFRSGAATFFIADSALQKFGELLRKYPTSGFIAIIGDKVYQARVVEGGFEVSDSISREALLKIRDTFDRLAALRRADLVKEVESRRGQPTEESSQTPAEPSEPQPAADELSVRINFPVPANLEIKRRDQPAGAPKNVIHTQSGKPLNLKSGVYDVKIATADESIPQTSYQMELTITSELTFARSIAKISSLEVSVSKLDLLSLHQNPFDYPLTRGIVIRSSSGVNFELEVSEIRPDGVFLGGPASVGIVKTKLLRPDPAKSVQPSTAELRNRDTAASSPSVSNTTQQPMATTPVPDETTTAEGTADEQLKIEMGSQVPLAVSYRDPAQSGTEAVYDIGRSRWRIMGPFSKGRYDFKFQSTSSETGEKYDYPVVLEFDPKADLSRLKPTARKARFELTERDYELLRESKFEVYITIRELPGPKQIGDDGQLGPGPSIFMCSAVTRAQYDATQSYDDFRMYAEMGGTIIATLRSKALTQADTQKEVTPAPTPPETKTEAATKSLDVRLATEFKANIKFDKLDLPEYSSEAFVGINSYQSIPPGIHPLTLSYTSTDGSQTFSQPLLLEVLPEINELDVGEIAGEFRLTLYELALIQQGLFGRALVVYGTPNERVTAAGRVGSGAAVSEINTILDLEAMRSKANEFSRFERSFGREGQPKGRIVAILHSPDYDEKIRLRHQFYLPSRGGTRSGLGRMDWTLLTPDDIPAMGTVVELFHVNADASSVDELRIVAAGQNAPATRQYKIGEVTANEIYLSQSDWNIGSLQPDPNTAPLRPLSRLFFPQQARDQDLILVPKDKYTPETLTTEIWNKLHPPAKD